MFIFARYLLVKMAERPSDPTNIVDKFIDVTVEDWNFSSLSVSLTDNEKCLQWLAARKLIHNDFRCC
jgi:hypothetical protein